MRPNAHEEFYSAMTTLEKEIFYYLQSRKRAVSVEEITRGVFNPKVINKANLRELSSKVYFALLSMKGVTNINPLQQGSLEDKMNGSRWMLKENHEIPS
jgi:hypothetical protein